MSIAFTQHREKGMHKEKPDYQAVDGIRPIAVVGPTASGKSALGIALAHELDGEIVNVDSMQLYRGMDIGTAKLSLSEREGIPHHQLDVWEVTETASVARFQQDAVRDVEDIMARGKTPILVGGSMLYVQALVDAWQFPPTDKKVRAQWEEKLAEIGIDALHRHLALLDPAAAEIIEDKDPRRTVRALEVIELTGQPFQASQPPKNGTPRWGTRILGLRTHSDWLNPRIELRTRLMFEHGFVAEVESLLDKGLVADSTAGRAIGYAQVLQGMAGDLTWDEVVDRTITGTRRYVRRQRSWFNRDPRISWIDAAEDTPTQALSLLT
ncbi:tRNA dimethylallyltransferase [Corynebacterium ulcerans]|uniref:tRNA dimethylallyltransferase n=2 Tax=Corynebacterium ulcerans TaxID=65058 RepID=A0ABD0BHR3_CORUL|nr:tRNA dimethylallyltransferase [Corynebacterium ulcerans]BAM27669.1 tRNA delta(2)-isopentenylpyrophosphate transferase [Corynebacterium ulcerans 0102]BBJ72314.1 tRNA dimethylallyltransferase [Corynebacterium ulcerans]BBJ74619.1 tRNA dimethylallyltransferase [Corynebacterium ulcerans]GJJ33701.1 tRNA dimethylallyltransferase [Corynebacterium ulcerans]